MLLGLIGKRNTTPHRPCLMR